MTPLELFSAGRFSDAVLAQRAAVTTSADWLFLCELLMLNGSFDEARHELDSLNAASNELHDYIAEFHLLLNAEQGRQRLMIDTDPIFFADPPPHARLRLKAVQAIRTGKHRAASRQIDAANDASPFIAGHVDGREFEGLRDGDDRFASILEVLSSGQYAWLPFEDISRLRLEQAITPRDRYFVPAQVRLLDGTHHGVYLPVLYAASHQHADAPIRCGHETDWFTQESGIICGVGLRVWTFDDYEELTPWEITQLELRHA